uniref:Si:ch73-22o12.1 n=1 Tax=Poecilia latipinna TaxID=48699 RepID=A0A3B3UG80_9TELE
LHCEGGTVASSLLLYADPKHVPLQVTWIYEPKDGERMNIAVFHPSYGPNYPESQMKGRVTFKPSQPELSSPSIEISDVRMTDEGRYVCEYATYPDGNEQGITQLVMLAKPVNSATTVAEVAGTKPVVVARCVSRDGRPAAKIRWVTTAKGNWTETSKTGADNTVTVTSEYRLAPTPTDNAKDLTCLVNHRTQLKDESLPLKLAIRYPPMVEIEGYDNNWYLGRTNVGLLCKANANPVPHTVQWTTMTGQLPDTVLPNEKELKVLKVDNSVNTTFVCEVKNSIGTTREQITIHVRDQSPFAASALHRFSSQLHHSFLFCSLSSCNYVSLLFCVLVFFSTSYSLHYPFRSHVELPTNRSSVHLSVQSGPSFLLPSVLLQRYSFPEEEEDKMRAKSASS